jgi:hypothetical protein
MNEAVNSAGAGTSLELAVTQAGPVVYIAASGPRML